MSEPIVRVRDIGWVTGGVTVLEHVGFDVAPGELVAIMGRNGAGKSTLLDIIGGLRMPSEGVVAIADRPLAEWRPANRARVVAHLPQNLRADLTMRAEALVLMGRYAHAAQWFESDDDREVAHTAMRRCDCLQYRDRSLGTLSGGERQRVLLAACLAQQPRVLLLDEPTTFLDVDQQLHCFTLLRDEAGGGTACLAVTHDINLALTFCTRLIVLAEHSIAYDMLVGAALADPSWLRVFSDRLHVDRGAGTAAWVRYQ
ncbi:MAG: ABC transporter ATP-binding protein [Acidimicrobiia bacterium]|nr:ABC transporter ATP-binding protein [Acidimicrobiia bacterium]